MKAAIARNTRKRVNPVMCDSGSFSLEIRIRGNTHHLHRENCNGLEDAIRIGEKWFRAFEARNPCFVQDSQRKRIS